MNFQECKIFTCNHSSLENIPHEIIVPVKTYIFLNFGSGKFLQIIDGNEK